MTALLSIERVSKAYPDGVHRAAVLDRVSFELLTGAQLGVYGEPRSGKSTLLRIAAGIERPDFGSVRVEGSDLARLRGAARARLLRRFIGYISISDWRPVPGECMLDHVATALGSDGFTPKEARSAALRALERVGFDRTRRYALLVTLTLAERTRLALARALVREPRVLVIDEPATMPSVTEREQFCQLLRAISEERSIALLAASAELAALQGFQLMSISNGELCSTLPSHDNVVRLPLADASPMRPLR
jgi:predicted ABC-type transport system involved in lysophospholipase L1 biosynthesis ATPase subunit